jgi:predicted GH43/DUF377 family glycosyl hydrolase
MKEFTITGLPHQHAFNPALVRWKGRILIIYRTGHWEISTLFLGELDDQFRAIGEFHPIEQVLEDGANEDPRFFIWRGELYFSFGIHRAQRSVIAIARITEDLQVRDIRVLTYDVRQSTEKNWIFFAHGDDLYCTYAMMDGIHQVLRVQGDVCVPAYVTRYRDPWTWGHARGGTQLIEHNGLWFGFFHGTALRHDGDASRYFMGAYALKPEPPFPLVKMSGQPLYTPAETRIVPSQDNSEEMKISVIFPAGLLSQNGRWMIAAGYNDDAIKILEISEEELDHNLVATEIGDQPVTNFLVRSPHRSRVHFPEQDPYWKRLVDIMQAHVLWRELVAGPERLAGIFDDFVSCASLDEKSFSEVRWLIVHKGHVDELSLNILQQLKSRFIPFYADDVFVILTDKVLPTRVYEFDANHDRALWIIIENLLQKSRIETRKKKGLFSRLKWR